MDGEGRIPPLLVAGLVFLVLVIGALAYYAGRFGRESPAEESTVELPPPGPPDPAVAVVVPTPADVPPTVTPSVAVMIERETRATRATRSSAPLVQRSTEIEVKVPPVVPPVGSGGVVVAPTFAPTPRRPIVVEVVTPALVPTPLAIEPERDEEEDAEREEEAPQPEPTIPPM